MDTHTHMYTPTNTHTHTRGMDTGVPTDCTLHVHWRHHPHLARLGSPPTPPLFAQPTLSRSRARALVPLYSVEVLCIVRESSNVGESPANALQLRALREKEREKEREKTVATVESDLCFQFPAGTVFSLSFAYAGTHPRVHTHTHTHTDIHTHSLTPTRSRARAHTHTHTGETVADARDEQLRAETLDPNRPSIATNYRIIG
jgi:hypothetical protein